MRSVERQEISRTAKIIRTLMQQKQYREVVRIAEGMDLSEVNNRLMILDITNAYEQLRDKNSAKETLLNYYRSYGITGRNMIQKLVELCFETRDVENGIALCYKFVNEWPESSLFYLMSYHISTYEDQNIETQIMYLEKYTSMEFKERWMYELARLYANNRQNEKCIMLCHELICLYGHGVYIEKAAELKNRVCGLSEDEVRVLEAAKERAQEAKLNEEKKAEQLREEKNEESAESAVPNEEIAKPVQPNVLILEEAEEENSSMQDEIATGENVSGEVPAEGIEEEKISEEVSVESVEEEKSEEVSAEGIEEEKNSEEVSIEGIEEEQNFEKVSVEAGEDIETAEKDIQTEEGRLSEAEEERIRQISEEKVRQTEAAARERIEREERLRRERESKLNEALNGEDRYGQVEKSGSDQIFYPDIVKKTDPVKQKKKNRRGLFDRFAESFKDTLQTDGAADTDDEEFALDNMEYMVMGINPEAYTDGVERRVIQELELLDSDEIAELTPAQIKEIYELKILHDVKEIIRDMILDFESVSEESLDAFVGTDPYKNDVLERIRREDEEELEHKTESASAESEAGEESESEEIVPTISQTAAETAAKVIENAKALVQEVKEAAGLSGNPLEENEEESEPESDVLKESPVSEEKSDTDALNTEKKSVLKEEKKSADKAAEKQTLKTDGKKLKKKTRAVLASVKNPDEGMGIKEFIDCVVACADEMGYEVEADAHITLAALAEEMLSERIILSLNCARRVTEHAIRKQQNRSALDKFMDRYGKKRGNVLRDKHFNMRIKKA